MNKLQLSDIVWISEPLWFVKLQASEVLKLLDCEDNLSWLAHCTGMLPEVPFGPDFKFVVGKPSLTPDMFIYLGWTSAVDSDGNRARHIVSSGTSEPGTWNILSVIAWNKYSKITDEKAFSQFTKLELLMLANGKQ